MPLNNLPLLSVSTVKAALEQINAASSTSTAKSVDGLPNAAQASTVVVEAKVVAVQVQGQQVLLTLSAEGQQFQVQSDLPLPAGTKLTLQVTTYPQEADAETKVTVETGTNTGTKADSKLSLDVKVEVLVQKIILPENKTTPPTQALIQRFISERLALLDASVRANGGKQTATTDTYLKPSAQTSTETSAQTNIQAAAQTNASPSSAVRASDILSALALLQPAHPLTKTLPTEVQQILKQWQQSLPNIQQLAQTASVKESIQQSGVQYEKQVMELLAKMQASTGTEPKALFKALWAKASELGAASALEASKMAVSKLTGTLNKASGSEPTLGVIPHSAVTGTSSDARPVSGATPEPNRIEQILKAVQSALEQPFQLTAEKLAQTKLSPEKLAAQHLLTEKPEASPPSLLQTLLGSNHKAVISRALLIWARTIAEQPNQSLAGSARSLPLTPQANGPEAFQLLQRALAHIEHEQVRLLQPNEPWQLNVPLLFKEGGQQHEVRMELWKDNDENKPTEGEAKESLWRLRLFFDLKNLGGLDADIELRFPNVKVTFWSKQQDTLNSLSHALKPLQEKLIALGAEVEDIQVKYGQLPETSRNLINQRLVDAKA